VVGFQGVQLNHFIQALSLAVLQGAYSEQRSGCSKHHASQDLQNRAVYVGSSCQAGLGPAILECQHRRRILCHQSLPYQQAAAGFYRTRPPHWCLTPEHLQGGTLLHHDMSYKYLSMRLISSRVADHGAGVPPRGQPADLRG